MHCAQFCSWPTMQIYQNSKSRMESRCQSPILSCLLRQFPFLPLKLHLVGQVLTGKIPDCTCDVSTWKTLHNADRYLKE